MLTSRSKKGNFFKDLICVSQPEEMVRMKFWSPLKYQIGTFDDEQYFDLLLRLCIRNAEKGEGVLYLNARDLAYMPQDFEQSINAAIYETGAVQVSREPKDIENGFVLVYGDIEVNCTLRAVFDERMDALKDLLHPLLFA